MIPSLSPNPLLVAGFALGVALVAFGLACRALWLHQERTGRGRWNRLIAREEEQLFAQGYTREDIAAIIRGDVVGPLAGIDARIEARIEADRQRRSADLIAALDRKAVSARGDRPRTSSPDRSGSPSEGPSGVSPP